MKIGFPSKNNSVSIPKSTPFLAIRLPASIRRFTALILILTLSLSDSLAYAESLFRMGDLGQRPGEYPFSLAPVSPSDLFPLMLPENLGHVSESYQGTSGHTVFYIQDAHDSLEAQENIAKLIDHFVRHYGVRTVFEEGYEGKVPTDDYFGFIQDPEMKRKFSYFLMDQLRLGGAEFAHINRKQIADWRSQMADKNLPSPISHLPSGFELYGADNIQAHLENVRAYQEASKFQKAAAEDLDALQKEIRILADRYFPEDFKKWMKEKERFEKGKSEIMEYLKRTKDCRPPPKNGRIRPLAEKTTDLKKYRSIDSFLSTASLKKVFSLRSSVFGLFQELHQLENEISNFYLKTPRDQKIFEYLRQIKLLKRLNQFELSSEEFDVAKSIAHSARLPARQAERNALRIPLSAKPSFTEEIAQFIARETGKPLVLSKFWESSIQEAMRFYELAGERDRAIEKALTRQSVVRQAHHPEQSRRAERMAHGVAESRSALSAMRYASILVFGGFHSSAIKSMLKRRGDSYYVITPKITGPSKRHEDYYRRLMTDGFHPYEKSLGLAPRATVPGRALEVLSQTQLRMLFDQFSKINQTSPELATRQLSRTEMRTLKDIEESHQYPSERRELRGEIIKKASGMSQKPMSRSEVRTDTLKKFEPVYVQLLDDLKAQRLEKSRQLGILGRVAYKFAAAGFLMSSEFPSVSLHGLQKGLEDFRSKKVMEQIPVFADLYQKYAQSRTHSRLSTLEAFFGQLAQTGELKALQQMLSPFFISARVSADESITSAPSILTVGKSPFERLLDSFPLAKASLDLFLLDGQRIPPDTLEKIVSNKNRKIDSKHLPFIYLDERYSFFGDIILELLLTQVSFYSDSPIRVEKLRSDKALSIIMEENLTAMGIENAAARNKFFKATLFEGMLALVFEAYDGIEKEGFIRSRQFLVELVTRAVTSSEIFPYVKRWFKFLHAVMRTELRKAEIKVQSPRNENDAHPPTKKWERVVQWIGFPGKLLSEDAVYEKKRAEIRAAGAEALGASVIPNSLFQKRRQELRGKKTTSEESWKPVTKTDFQRIADEERGRRLNEIKKEVPRHTNTVKENQIRFENAPENYRTALSKLAQAFRELSEEKTIENLSFTHKQDRHTLAMLYRMVHANAKEASRKPLSREIAAVHAIVLRSVPEYAAFHAQSEKKAPYIPAYKAAKYFIQKAGVEKLIKKRYFEMTTRTELRMPKSSNHTLIAQRRAAAEGREAEIKKIQIEIRTEMLPLVTRNLRRFEHAPNPLQGAFEKINDQLRNIVAVQKYETLHVLFRDMHKNLQLIINDPIYKKYAETENFIILEMRLKIEDSEQAVADLRKFGEWILNQKTNLDTIFPEEAEAANANSGKKRNRKNKFPDPLEEIFALTLEESEKEEFRKRIQGVSDQKKYEWESLILLHQMIQKGASQSDLGMNIRRPVTYLHRLIKQCFPIYQKYEKRWYGKSSKQLPAYKIVQYFARATNAEKTIEARYRQMTGRQRDELRTQVEKQRTKREDKANKIKVQINSQILPLIRENLKRLGKKIHRDMITYLYRATQENGSNDLHDISKLAIGYVNKIWLSQIPEYKAFEGKWYFVRQRQLPLQAIARFFVKASKSEKLIRERYQEMSGAGVRRELRTDVEETDPLKQLRDKMKEQVLPLMEATSRRLERSRKTDWRAHVEKILTHLRGLIQHEGSLYLNYYRFGRDMTQEMQAITGDHDFKKYSANESVMAVYDILEPMQMVTDLQAAAVLIEEYVQKVDALFPTDVTRRKAKSQEPQASGPKTKRGPGKKVPKELLEFSLSQKDIEAIEGFIQRLNWENKTHREIMKYLYHFIAPSDKTDYSSTIVTVVNDEFQKLIPNYRRLYYQLEGNSELPVTKIIEHVILKAKIHSFIRLRYRGMMRIRTELRSASHLNKPLPEPLFRELEVRQTFQSMLKSPTQSVIYVRADQLKETSYRDSAFAAMKKTEASQSVLWIIIKPSLLTEAERSILSLKNARFEETIEEAYRLYGRHQNGKQIELVGSESVITTSPIEPFLLENNLGFFAAVVYVQNLWVDAFGKTNGVVRVMRSELREFLETLRGQMVVQVAA